MNPLIKDTIAKLNDVLHSSGLNDDEKVYVIAKLASQSDIGDEIFCSHTIAYDVIETFYNNPQRWPKYYAANQRTEEKYTLRDDGEAMIVFIHFLYKDTVLDVALDTTFYTIYLEFTEDVVLTGTPYSPELLTPFAEEIEKRFEDSERLSDYIHFPCNKEDAIEKFCEVLDIVENIL